MTIKDRWTGKVLWEGECDNIRKELEAALKSGANLFRANLGGANLDGASLVRANLYGANLVGANLDGANLDGASLDGASLVVASLVRANLYGASLVGANLVGANLVGANLVGANLDGASLDRASLDGASLYRANLVRATGIAPERCTPLLMLLDQPGPIRAYKLVTDDWTGPTYPGITYTIGETVEVAGADCDAANHCGAGINVATLDWCLRDWRPGWHIIVVEFGPEDIAAIPTGTDGKFRLHRCRVAGEKDLTGMVPATEEVAPDA